MRTTVALALTVSLGMGVRTAWADQAILSAGPLTAIGISADLNCAVNHSEDDAGEFYKDTACGTLLAVGGGLFGPVDIPAGDSASPRTAFTPVDQSAVSGDGTAGDPYRIVTTVDLDGTDVRIVQTDSYVVGEESYRTDVELRNMGESATDVTLYRAGDCFLQDSDYGLGSVDFTTGAVACVDFVFDSASGVFVPGDRIEQWLPVSPGSHFYENDYDALWILIGTQLPFDDTCTCTELMDNAAGLSWTFSVPAGGSVTRSHLTTFSPLGKLPLSTTKTADAQSVIPGALDGYTITIRNPNATFATLDVITDVLPNGFAYVAGSTQGDTTADPSVAGQTLTWSGPFVVPGATNGSAGSVSLHFAVTVSSDPGEYFNNATAQSEGFTVAPTGDTARVVVEAPTTTTSSTSTSTVTSTSMSTSSTETPTTSTISTTTSSTSSSTVSTSTSSSTTTTTSSSTVTTTTTVAPNRPPVCAGARAEPASVWPPNHALVDVAIAGIVDADGDPVTVKVTGIKQDEPVEGRGDGSTCPDGAGVGSDLASVRAERAASGDGRVYQIAFEAKDGKGGTCTGTAAVCVPHDAGGSCVAGGQPVDATTPANCTSVAVSTVSPLGADAVFPVSVDVPADTPGRGAVKVKAQAFYDSAASTLVVRAADQRAAAAKPIKVSAAVARGVKPGGRVTLTLKLNGRGKRLLQQQTPLPLRINVRVKRKGIEATAFDFGLRWRR
jgi:hypothetical protein